VIRQTFSRFETNRELMDRAGLPRDVQESRLKEAGSEEKLREHLDGPYATDVPQRRIVWDDTGEPLNVRR
jgi:hypothetical protein